MTGQDTHLESDNEPDSLQKKPYLDHEVFYSKMRDSRETANSLKTEIPFFWRCKRFAVKHGVKEFTKDSLNQHLLAALNDMSDASDSEISVSMIEIVSFILFNSSWSSLFWTIQLPYTFFIIFPVR